MGLLDIIYEMQVYIAGIWNYIFSYSSDNTHSSVFLFFHQPIFSYSIGGLPVYTYLMMFFTILLLAVITLMEKGAVPGETAPTSSPSVKETAIPTIGGKRRSKSHRK